MGSIPTGGTMSENNFKPHGKTPVEHVAAAEQFYQNDIEAKMRVDKAASLLEIAIMDHTDDEVPNKDRGLMRLAMIMYVYLEREDVIP